MSHTSWEKDRLRASTTAIRLRENLILIVFLINYFLRKSKIKSTSKMMKNNDVSLTEWRWECVIDVGKSIIFRSRAIPHIKPIRIGALCGEISIHSGGD